MIVCTGNDKEFEKYKDKVKNRKVKFHIKDIFNDWWDDYKIKFADKPRRPTVYKVVDNFLKC